MNERRNRDQLAPLIDKLRQVPDPRHAHGNSDNVKKKPVSFFRREPLTPNVSPRPYSLFLKNFSAGILDTQRRLCGICHTFFARIRDNSRHPWPHPTCFCHMSDIYASGFVYIACDNLTYHTHMALSPSIQREISHIVSY